ncbi:MAG: zinc ribbon domain-containing protein [Micrococcales bacterium]|nr:zinc ribbon domain-containing protein [Micrococcales bacterium]
MNCGYCGTPLPAGALFCVECGRSVAEPAPVARPAATASPSTPVAAVAPASPGLHAPHCPQCGSAIDDGDIFCGECGFVLRPMTGATPIPDPVRPDTVSEPPLDLRDDSAGEPGASEKPDAPGEADLPGEFAGAEESAPVDGLDAAADGVEPASEPLLPVEWGEGSASGVPPTRFLAPQPASLEDIESTRIVAARAPGERYVLQFSTGESIVVAGTGLIGRNPSPEPGEYVDELVPIFDVGKSVSKSHVEFGQEGGRFWVADRYSTNGTVIRQPDAPVVRCEPGKRYMIARGSRVEIGEQFFVVS